MNDGGEILGIRGPILAEEPGFDIDLGSHPREPQTTNTQLKLVDIWRQVLGIETIGVSDDFVELGGDSLAALILAAEIEATFGIKFQLSDVIDLSTIAKQAVTVDRKMSPMAQLPSHVTVGRATGARAPVFIVHGAWGFSFLKRAFIEELGQDRPVFLFQAPGLDGRTRPLASVKQIANLYVETMREIQPTGPYNIVAICAGAFIALEMSNILKEDNAEVDRLILLDPPNRSESILNSFIKGRFQIEPQQLDRILKKIRSFRAWHGRSKLRSALRQFLRASDVTENREVQAKPADRLKNRMQRRRSRSADWINGGTDLPQTMVQTVKELKRALRSHAHRPYAGKATMLLTSRTGNKILNDKSFWCTHLQGIDYQIRDWNHKDVFGLHISETARFVKDALEVPWDARLMPGAIIGSL